MDQFNSRNIPERSPDQNDAMFEWRLAELRQATIIHDLAEAVRRLPTDPDYLAIEGLFTRIANLQSTVEDERYEEKRAIAILATERAQEVLSLKQTALELKFCGDFEGALEIYEEARKRALEYFGENSRQVTAVEKAISALKDPESKRDVRPEAAESEEENINEEQVELEHGFMRRADQLQEEFWNGNSAESLRVMNKLVTVARKKLSPLNDTVQSLITLETFLNDWAVIRSFLDKYSELFS